MDRIQNIEPLTKEEIRDKRHHFLYETEEVTKIYKGDKRVHGSRVCVICGTSLSTVILSTGKTQAIRDHFSCKASPLLTVNICMDSRVCQRVHKRLRGD